MYWRSHLLATAGVIFLLTHPAYTQVDIQTVAITGDTAPGGDRFNAFEVHTFPPPATADGAFSLFPATTEMTQEGASHTGVFGGLTGQLQALFLANTAAPGTNGPVFTNTDSMMDSVVVNDQGVAALRGFLTGGDAVTGYTDVGIWAGAPGQLQLLARGGQTVPSPEGDERFASFNPPGIGNSGQVVLHALTSAKWRVYAGGAPENLRLIVSNGDSAPITIPNRTDPLTLQINGFSATGNHTRINSSSHVGLSARIEGFSVSTAGERGIFLSRGAGIEVVAHTAQNRFDNNFNSPLAPGSEAPGTGQRGRFTEMGAFEINDAGQVAFHANFTGNEAGGSGLWIGTPGSLQLIARSGLPTGVEGTTFDKFSVESAGGFLNESSQVVFLAQALNPDQSVRQIVFRGGAGSIAPIAFQGQNADAAGPGWRFQGFFGLTINDAGQVAFVAQLENGSASHVESLWFASAEGDLKMVTRVGAPFQIRPGDERTVRQIKPSRIDDDGQVVVRLEFEARPNEDFTSGIFIAGLPNVLLGADFYWGGPTAVDDNWHTASPRTNWEDSLGITTTIPGTAGTERVFIEGAAVRISDAPVTIGSLTATGTLTIRNRFEVNTDSTAGAVVLDQPQSSVVATGELKLTAASRWDGGTIGGGLVTTSGQAPIGGLVNEATLEIGGTATKTILNGLFVNRGEVAQTSSFNLDQATIINETAGKFRMRPGVAQTREIGANGESRFFNRGELEVVAGANGPTLHSVAKPATSDVAIAVLRARYVSLHGFLLPGSNTQLHLAGGSFLDSGAALLQGELHLLGGEERPHTVSGEFTASGASALRLPDGGYLNVNGTFTNRVGAVGPGNPDQQDGFMLEGGQLTIDGTFLNEGTLLRELGSLPESKLSPVIGSGALVNRGDVFLYHPGASVAPLPPFDPLLVNRGSGRVELAGELIVANDIENDGESTLWRVRDALIRADPDFVVSAEFINNKGRLETAANTLPKFSRIDLPVQNLGGSITVNQDTTLRTSRNTIHKDKARLQTKVGAVLELDGDDNTFGDLTILTERGFDSAPEQVHVRGNILRIDGVALIDRVPGSFLNAGTVAIDTTQILMTQFYLENRGRLDWRRGDLSGGLGIQNGGTASFGELLITGAGRKLLDSRLDNSRSSTVTVEEDATLLIGENGVIDNVGSFTLKGRLVSGEDNQQVVGSIFNRGRFNVPVAGNHAIRSAFDNTGRVVVSNDAFLSFKGTVKQLDFDNRTLNGGFWESDGGRIDISGVHILTNNAALELRKNGQILDLPSATSTASFDNQRSLSLAEGAQLHMGGHFDNNGFLKVDPTSTLRVGSFDNWDNCVVDGLIFYAELFNHAFAGGDRPTLSGTGTLTGNVTSGGTISPGNSPGTLTIIGNYTQLATGILRIDLANPSSFDLLSVSGDVTLNGTLAVYLPDGYLPTSSDTFTVLETTQPIAGSFASVSNGRVLTADFTGTFSVVFAENATQVVLSDFVRAADSDSDGMSDPYEAHFGFNPNDPADAAVDSDGDGEDNLAEFRAATDPNDPASIARSGRTLNISTRLRVRPGDDALIAGYIITGSTPKQVIVRALGPSLGVAGVADTLADPTLELFDSNGSSIGFNADWKDTQQTEIEATTIPPTDDAEAAIVQTLSPGAYTAVVSGVDQGSGVSLVEVYDLSGAPAKLANISTRGFVDIGDNVMIGGFIVGGGLGVNGGGSARVIARALGPSLLIAGVPNPLQDPMLEVYNSNGDVIAANDNWRSSQETEIEATTIPPLIDREAAVVTVVPAGAYTTVVRGADNGTGVGLVEVYNLNP